jgi:ubiquitin C-terminal hydrolase
MGSIRGFRTHSRIAGLPPVLVIHLRRFRFDVAAQAVFKVDDVFEFPEELEVGPTVGELLVYAPGGAILYALVGTVILQGRPGSGHYPSLIRQGQQWFDFDDDRVATIDGKEALSRSFGRRPDGSACLLFYVANDFRGEEGSRIDFFHDCDLRGFVGI